MLIKKAHGNVEKSLQFNHFDEESNDSLMILANAAENHEAFSSNMNNIYDEETSRQSSEMSKAGFDETSMDSIEPIDMSIKKKKRKNSVIAQSMTKKKKSKKSKTDGNSTKNPDEFDENDNDNGELLYCLCNRPSHGNMIECSNEACTFEWFHFSCVGLKKRVPKGKW